LSNALIGVFPDGLDDSFKELRPVTFIEAASHYRQLFLPFMTDKCSPQLLGIIVDIFSEPEHNHKPEIIRLYHNIPMVHVCLVETVEKPIRGRVGELAVLRIGQKLPVSGPELSPLLFCYFFRLFSF
jgi:hypothetical protein